MNQVTFPSLPLSEELLRAVADMGYSEATHIQSQSIPLILEGHDLIGRSHTGSGKTAAFGLPVIEKIDLSINPKITQCLILCPTRELAMQASNELKKFAKFKDGIHIVPVYGGDSIAQQIIHLRQGCQIVVGTPGRIMDHLRRKTLHVDNVSMVVLDEADEMLSMGFVEDIETILTTTPVERQTILFSATMPSSVMEITKKFQNNPKIVEIEQPQKTVSTIDQFFVNVPKGHKTAVLCRLLAYYKPTSCMIFSNTKLMVDELIVELNKRGFCAEGLHGDMRQAARTQVLNRFKSGQSQILVATDVAARGIDVSDIKIVINYDLPQEDEYYVHRIGRTGRAGKSGQAITLVQGNRQLAQLKNLMRYTKCDMKQLPLPTLAQIRERQLDEFCEGVKTFMAQNDFSKNLAIVEKLMGESYTTADIAAALMAMTVKSDVQSDDIPADFNEFDLGSDAEKTKFTASKQKNSAKPGTKKREYNNENMVSVRISVGRKDKVSPNNILGAVAGESGLSGSIFGAININHTYTTIDVPKEHHKTVLQKVNKAKIKGKVVSVN